MGLMHALRNRSKVDILRQLRHPNVVNIYEFYQDDPAYYYMVLELMEGGELFDRIVKKVSRATIPTQSMKANVTKEIERFHQPTGLAFLQDGGIPPSNSGRILHMRSNY